MKASSVTAGKVVVSDAARAPYDQSPLSPAVPVESAGAEVPTGRTIAEQKPHSTGGSSW